MATISSPNVAPRLRQRDTQLECLKKTAIIPRRASIYVRKVTCLPQAHTAHHLRGLPPTSERRYVAKSEKSRPTAALFLHSGTPKAVSTTFRGPAVGATQTAYSLDIMVYLIGSGR